MSLPYCVYFTIQGCQGDNITKRSLGTQDEASFSTDDKGHISITYTGGNADRYVN